MLDISMDGGGGHMLTAQQILEYYAEGRLPPPAIPMLYDKMVTLINDAGGLAASGLGAKAVQIEMFRRSSLDNASALMAVLFDSDALVQKGVPAEKQGQYWRQATVMAHAVSRGPELRL